MTCESQVMKKTHYYLVDTSVIIPGAAVSELEFKIIHEDQPFVVNNLKVTPLFLAYNHQHYYAQSSSWRCLRHELDVSTVSDHPITCVAWK